MAQEFKILNCFCCWLRQGIGLGRMSSGQISLGLQWRCGQWCIAPKGIPQFDGRKDNPSPRPAVFIDSYGGFLRLLGRSTKANDAHHKIEHQPHKGRCDLGVTCWINEPGYVSVRRTDVWTPLASQVKENIACFEPDDDFIDRLFDVKSKI
jgi:hypothetical protein